MHISASKLDVMKKTNFVFPFLAALLLTALISCGGDSGGSPPPINPDPNTGWQAGQKYFGYYASEMDGVGVMNDIDELVGKSNFVFIHSGDMRNLLAHCRETGMKAMVSVSWLTFDPNMRLYPDWEARLSFATDIMDKYQDVIIANYLLDEPYMNGADHGVSVQEMYNSLETVGQFFKARYPQMPLAIIFSADELNKGFQLPPSADWFGMDCYDGFSSCGKRTIPDYYQLLKNQIYQLEAVDHRSRQLMAVPPAGWEQNNASKESVHLSQVSQYRAFIKSEKRITVVVPFIWQTFGTASTGGWFGARNSESLKAAYIQMYNDFMNGTL